MKNATCTLTRRQWMQAGAGLACGWGTFGIVPFAHAAKDGLTMALPLMGTMVQIQALGLSDKALHIGVSAAFQEMSRLTNMMSRFKPDSMVNAINLAAGITPVVVPPELMQVLRLAQSVSERTDGSFDITVGSVQGWAFTDEGGHMPDAASVRRQQRSVNFKDLKLDTHRHTAYLQRQGMRLDLGGIAKHAILDAGMQVLKQHGIRQAMINGGGDVLTMGGHAGKPWRVGIRDPRAPSRLLGIVKLNEGIVASSGDYERYFTQDGQRYHHIIDPKTGYPSHGPHGVTLVAGHYSQLDGLGAAIMVMGQQAGQALINRRSELEGLIVGPHQDWWQSSGMADLLA